MLFRSKVTSAIQVARDHKVSMAIQEVSVTLDPREILDTLARSVIQVLKVMLVIPVPRVIRLHLRLIHQQRQV